MPEVKKPRTGSMQFWPRKRAARIFPHLSTYPSVDGSSLDKPKLLAYAGYKAGMLQILTKDLIKGSPTFGEDIVVPVTVLDCPPLVAVGLRTYRMTTNGLAIIADAWADKLPKGLEGLRKAKKANKAKKEKKDVEGKSVEGQDLSAEQKAHLEHESKSQGHNFSKMEKESDSTVAVRLVLSTQPRLSGIGKSSPEVFEIEIVGKSVSEKISFARGILGKEVKPTEVFREGDFVDAVAVTRGKGMVGPTRRFGAVIQNRHATHKRRHIGSLGQEQPGKVRHTVPQAGQMGFQQRTEHNKRLMKVADAEGSGKDVTPVAGFNRYGLVKGPYILIEGSVPGPKKRLIFLRSPIRQGRNKFILPEVKEIIK
jgi:large subunit ribosomal protein L3